MYCAVSRWFFAVFDYSCWLLLLHDALISTFCDAVLFAPVVNFLSLLDVLLFGIVVAVYIVLWCVVVWCLVYLYL
jgi:hypothetical protein